MAPTWEVSAEVLAQGMLRLAASPNLLERLRCPSPGELAARQHAFVLKSRTKFVCLGGGGVGGVGG